MFNKTKQQTLRLLHQPTSALKLVVPHFRFKFFNYTFKFTLMIFINQSDSNCSLYQTLQSNIADKSINYIQAT